MDESDNTPSQETTVAVPSVPIADALPSRYQLLSVLGSGGAGIVYKAHDTILGKNVAIKKLHQSASQTEAQRFHREAKALAALKHRNIMTALDFGVTEKNEPYLVLDYIKGESLADWLKRNGAMAQLDALAMFIEIADGLSHAHEKGIIHRDMKPSNVMLVENEQADSITAQLADFGLAKNIDKGQDFTKPGIGIGTPQYMSPEQIKGQEVDERTDIYSFGCLMFEVITGTKVFSANTSFEVMNKHLHEEPETISQRFDQLKIGSSTEVSSSLQGIISKCLKKDPTERFTNAKELHTALISEFDKSAADEHKKSATVFLGTNRIERRAPMIAVVSIAVVILCVVPVVIWQMEAHKMLGIFQPPNQPKVSATGLSGLTNESKRTRPELNIHITGKEKAEDRLKNLGSLTRLELIEDPGAKIPAKAIRILAEEGPIIQFELTCSRAGPLLKEIANIRGLQHLTLESSIKNAALGSLSALSKVQSLSTLVLDNYHITEEDIADIAELEISELKLRDCTGLANRELLRLSRSSPLVLELKNTDASDESMGSLKKALVSRLVLIAPSDKLTNRGIESLHNLETLVDLKIAESTQDYALGCTILEIRKNTIRIDPKTEYRKAVEASVVGNLKESISLFTKLIEQCPNLASLYHERGMVKYKLGDTPGALKDADRALQIASDPEALKYRGIYYSAQKEFKNAIKDLNESIRLRPTYSNYAERASVLRHQKNYAQALEDYTTAIELSGDTPKEDKLTDYLFARAEVYEKLGDKRKADTDRRDAIKIIYQAINSLSTQIELARRTTASRKSLGETYMSRANLYEKIGEKKLAESDRKSAKKVLLKATYEPVFHSDTSVLPDI